MPYSKTYLDQLTFDFIGAAIDVHRELGPGLIEGVYQKCLEHELRLRKISYSSQFNVPIFYNGLELDANLRCDFLIENTLLVEIKAVERILPVHEAQIISYLKLLKSPKGILINFNVVNLFREGQKTFVTELYRNLPD